MEREWKVFESKHQAIYDRFVFPKTNEDWEERGRKRRAEFFAELPSIRDRMRELFASAERIVAEKENAFRKLFPDLASDIPVYFLPAVYSFNGKVGEILGLNRTGILLGVDFIAWRQDDMDVLFAHEFFHAYQADKIKGETGKTMATPLWLEGFGTYVSGLLNPDRSDETLLMDAALAEECRKPEFVQELARLYLEVLPTDGEASYGDWFRGNGTVKPRRRGYCLGLQVIREVARSHELMEMVTWDEARFSVEAELVLKRLAGSN